MIDIKEYLKQTKTVLLTQDAFDELKQRASAQSQPEEDCDTCKHGYFGDRQCDNCRMRYPSHYEREEEQHGSD